MDSGISPNHQSFQNQNAEPHDPLPKYRGKCEVDPDTKKSFCNGKIVCAQHFAAAATTVSVFNPSVVKTSPRDGDGHERAFSSIELGLQVLKQESLRLLVLLELEFSMGLGELAFDEELEEPIEDQPLPANALPTALSPSYIADSDPEEDEEDPEEDPADYPTDGGDNDDNESYDDDNNDDDVVKDEEEEEDHLAPSDPSGILIDDLLPSSRYRGI
ncbi:subtilisin-like protease SBT2.6 isoform X1 [Tanacetum coccineum]